MRPAVLLEAPKEGGAAVDTDAPPVVFVEDSPEDYEAVRRTLRGVGFSKPMRHFEDGDSVLDYLHRLVRTNQPLPPALVLDLNLPGVDGREVLEEIRADDALRALPVVVLTTSHNPSDVEYCQQLGVVSYMLKPVRLDELRTKLTYLRDFLHEGTPPPHFE
ncbi:MAG: response regulator [Bacteroidota bacterium]